jgi:hypothetical protein
MYAMVTFFALASVYFQWKIMEGWKGGRVEGYVLATAAALYTHYFTIFLLVFQNLVWLVWVLAQGARGTGMRRARATLWLGAQVATLILFLPQLPLALRQTVAYGNPNLDPPGAGEFISRSWLAYTLSAAGEPALAGRLAWALAALLVLAVLWRLLRAWRAGNGAERGALAFLAGWFLVPLAVYFLVLQRRPSFEPRYVMFVTPALLLLLAWGLPVSPGSGVGVGRRVAWGSLALLFPLAAFAWGTWSYFTRVEAYKDDSAGVVAWLASQTTPDDVVYVDVPHPFHYYAERVPAPVRYLFVDVHTAADLLNAEAAGCHRFFWVTWRGSDTDPRGVVPFLLDKAGRRSGELDFRGYHVTWWDLPADAHFSLPDELQPYPAIFGDAVQLDGLAFSDAAQAGGAAWATLHFTLLRPTDVDYRVSVRLRAPGGDMLPSTDKDLLNDRHFRTSAWSLEDARLNQAINVYTLPVPSGTSAGEYCLEAVVYRADTLEPLPVAGDFAACPSPSGDGVSAPLGMLAVSP